MMNTKNKEFRDPVHGYISVPARWCSVFIDTAVFQRLRHIEQTSMRPLYPSAHHDRFVHSLGVYHLATIAFECLRRNTEAAILGNLDLDGYEQTFRIAALMHDCAHACFSHTFESYYSKNGKAQDFLLEHVDPPFKGDYEKRYDNNLKPAPHEVFSAAILLAHYGKALDELAPDDELRQIDLQLAARMITGCLHVVPNEPRQQFENCLIQLLNGQAIDVDKLDYVIRDTWSSGVDNVSIDVQRLLSALEIVRAADGLKVVFRKSALSVIQSVLDGRNHLFKWIYSHHTVCYFSRLLQDAVKKLNEVLSAGDTPDAFLEAVFSRQCFEEPVQAGRATVFLPCDDDIYSLLKAHKNEIAEMDELLSRRPVRVPLWKTQAEFETLFGDRTTAQRGMLRVEVPNILAALLGDNLRDSILVERVKPKIASFDEGKISVRLLGKDVPFQKIVETWRSTTGEKKNVSFFYVYVPREAEDRIQDCIEALRTAPIDA